MDIARIKFLESLQDHLSMSTSPLVAKILETEPNHDINELPSLWMRAENITFEHFLLRCLQHNDFLFLQKFATR